jgi:hypothetical protein
METSTLPSPESSAIAPRCRAVLLLLATVVVMLSYLTLPGGATDLDMDADASLCEVLAYAYQHGLQFGTDLLCNYGPLGFVNFVYTSPRTASACMVGSSIFCLVVAAGLCRVASRLRLMWGVGLVCSFLFVSTNVATRSDIGMDAGLLCWGLLCLVESDGWLIGSAVMFVALASFSALAKSSALFMVGPDVVLLAGCLAIRGRWRLGLGIVMGVGAALILGWLAAGQNLTHLGAHVRNALAIAQGYNQTLGWEARPLAIRSGLTVLVLALGAMTIRALAAFEVGTSHSFWRRLLLLAWLCSFLFPIWKHGFVRGDSGHLVFFYGFMPVLALALEILPCKPGRARRWSHMLQISCWLVSLLTVQLLMFPPVSISAISPFRSLVYHARSLLWPGEYLQSMISVTETNRTKAALPVFSQIIGHASVDMFGQQQIYALLNDWNYRPRPVCQSHAACNDQLMRLNENFYLSEQAPEYVLFALAPVDRKFPTLEDARVLRLLLADYELAETERAFLLLKRKSSLMPQLKLLREGTAQVGERIDMRNQGRAEIWLEIDLKPTWLGRLREFFLRPPAVRLASHRPGAGGIMAQRRAPAAMLAAGFVASPLLLSNTDVRDYLTGKDLNYPDSYSVIVEPQTRRFWRDSVHYRIYEILSSESR